MNAITLLSGGLDSVVATAIARRDYRIAAALTFDYGQRARDPEIRAARRFCTYWEIPHEVVALPWLTAITTTALVKTSRTLPQYQMQDLSNAEKQADSAAAVWVPNRNGVFLHIAAAYTEARGADAIITGFNAEEAATFPDNTAEFVTRINASLEYATLSHPRVISPTQQLTKRDIVQRGRALGVPLDWCWSCYEAGPAPCGHCESCVRSARAQEER